MTTSAIRVSDEVLSALATGEPVLALESTIFTHGLPRPRNIEVARRAIEVARDNGAVAATIGVVEGEPVVGLTLEEIEFLANDDNAVKISVRDLATARLDRSNGGTTIAATSFLAHKAGVKVFSSGGLGGVHHGATASFDESADMFTLAHVPIVLVSSGAKAILDIGATLERFETLSIPVLGYRTTKYPGFYVSETDFELQHTVQQASDVAEVYDNQRDLGLDSAILVANPVPEEDQLDPEDLKKVLDEAWAAAETQGIHGQDTTPFLLDYVQEHTEGRSLDANVALYYNNIKLGSIIASALANRA